MNQNEVDEDQDQYEELEAETEETTRKRRASNTANEPSKKRQKSPAVEVVAETENSKNLAEFSSKDLLTQVKDKSPKSDEASGSTSAKNSEESMSTLHQQPLEILESNPDNDQNKKRLQLVKMRRRLPMKSMMH